ncbi:MAG: hypothetical protein GX557_08660 [Chloroflexi bacterium]|nr:hypothetical protein [Chloroflexota bacterium]
MDAWASGIAELSRDNRSGASELEIRSIDLLEELVGDSSVGASAMEVRRWLLRAGRQLIGAQPAMANLFRLVNDLLWACESATRPEDVRQDALAFLQLRRTRQDAAQEAMAHAAAAYLASRGTLMTYSRSAAVLSTLQLLAQGRRLKRVYCSEGRPMLEGQTLATELGWAGVPVVLGIDMALFGWLREVEALVVGADTLSSSGVVNKLGTAALVRAAEERTIPRIVLCTTAKFVPDAYRLVDPLPLHAAEEIMPPADNIEIRNAYFEVTPLEAFSLVITETGAHDIAKVRSDLAALRIHPGLQGMLDS